MEKIVVLDGYTLNPGDLSWDGLKALGNLVVYDRTEKEDIIPRIGDAAIVMTNKTPLSAAVFEACPSLRYVGVLATGYNIIDLEAAKRRGVVVANVPSYSTQAVAQFTIALLLEICHHVGLHSGEVHAGRWQDGQDFCFWDYPLIELADKTMGIIGYGRIGRAVANIAHALGMRVLAHSRTLAADDDGVARAADLDTLLTQSDVVSLHCPLTPETRDMICAANIAKMKDGAILLNTSRGPLVNEQDLADALKSGKVYAAGMDVVSREPITPENPLLAAPNCIITPHIAWAATETRARLMGVVEDNLAAFLSGNPVNVVNP